nr:hypothetical protein [Tanacetum cinerariifolium]
ANKKRKGIDLLSEVALTEEAQYEEVRKKSLRDFHKTHQSGSGTATKIAPSVAKIKPFVTNKGTGAKPRVLDVTKEESISDRESDCGDDNTKSDNEKGSDFEHETDQNEIGSESDQEENEEDVEDDEDENDYELIKIRPTLLMLKMKPMFKIKMKFKKCNMRLHTDIKPKEATFQVGLDALALTTFYQAFLITAEVSAIYIGQEDENVKSESVDKSNGDDNDDGSSDDHDDIHDEENIDEEEEDEVTKELYDDVNVNMGNKDTKITSANQGASEQQYASQQSGFKQEEEDTHVTLTTVLDTQKTEELVDSSMRTIIKEEVNAQLRQILPQAISDVATPVIKKNINESLEVFVLTSKFAHAEETSHTIKDSGKQQDQEFVTEDNDEQPADKDVTKADWFKKPERPPTHDPDWIFRCDTYFLGCYNFSAFVMNRLEIPNLTQEILVGLAFNLLKGTCKSITELDYHFEECSKATTECLDWHNFENKLYPFNLKKPLPLIQDHRGRQIIPQYYFINNDLEYQKGGDLSRRYSTFVTKRKAATYDLKWIEDLVPKLWSPVQFSDGTLNDVRYALHDIAAGIRIEYLPMRKWSNLDKKRARVMVQDIDKQLY